MNRARVAELDELLGSKHGVLDDGFVIPVDYMGSDASIEAAARISYGAGTRSVSDRRALLRYLMRHRHTSPFEQAVITFHIRLPMDCHRQLVRHRTARLNEYSTRYSEAIDSMQKTRPHEWRAQSTTNKQGSSEGAVRYPPHIAEKLKPDAPSVGHFLSDTERAVQTAARAVYEERLAAGVAREQARKDLPLSTYTEIIWQCDAHNLMHFLSLRMDKHAQLEIRQYANTMFTIFRTWLPITAEAFEDYRLHALTLTTADIAVLASVIKSYGEIDWSRFSPIAPRERLEMRAKFQRLGLDGVRLGFRSDE